MSPDLWKYRDPLPRNADPAAIVERIYLLAEACKLANKLDIEIWRVIPVNRENDLEKVETEVGSAYPVDFSSLAQRLTVFADAWQAELDAQAEVDSALAQRALENQP